MPETGCDLCGDTAGPLHLHPKCHKAAPLRADLADGVLKLYCYVPECNRVVAVVMVASARAETLLALAAAAESFRTNDDAAAEALDARNMGAFRRARDARQAALAELVAHSAELNPTPPKANA